MCQDALPTQRQDAQLKLKKFTQLANELEEFTSIMAPKDFAVRFGARGMRLHRGDITTVIQSTWLSRKRSCK